MVDKTKQQSGFALLVSLIVVGAVLSIGLVVLDLSIKQVRLASTTKDSEIAFHAANAGMECARYWRRAASSTMEDGLPTPNVQCFGVSPDGNDPITVDTNSPNISAGTGDAYAYEYEFTWNSNQSCTNIKKLIAVSAINDSLTINNMTDLIPGYPEGDNLTCPAAGDCTVISVQGYNRSCAQKNSFGTIQREVLLEF